MLCRSITASAVLQEELHRLPRLAHAKLPRLSPGHSIFAFKDTPLNDLRTWAFGNGSGHPSQRSAGFKDCVRKSVALHPLTPIARNPGPAGRLHSTDHVLEGGSCQKLRLCCELEPGLAHHSTPTHVKGPGPVTEVATSSTGAREAAAAGTARHRDADEADDGRPPAMCRWKPYRCGLKILTYLNFTWFCKLGLECMQCASVTRCRVGITS